MHGALQPQVVERHLNQPMNRFYLKTRNMLDKESTLWSGSKKWFDYYYQVSKLDILSNEHAVPLSGCLVRWYSIEVLLRRL